MIWFEMQMQHVPFSKCVSNVKLNYVTVLLLRCGFIFFICILTAYCCKF